MSGQSAVTRHASAVAAVIVSVVLGRWLNGLVDPTLVFLVAVLIVAWFSGVWPAVIASVLSTLALDYFFIPPLYALSIDATHLPRVLAFGIIAFLFAGTSASRRRIEQSLKEAREDLEAKVRERTAELQAAHADAVATIAALRQAEADLRENERHLEELAGRLIHAQETERSRIGRELHDHISQMLGVLTIRIDQLRAEQELPPAAAEELEDLRRSTAEITDDIHSLSHRLHSSALDYLGLVPALQKLVAEFSNRHGIDVEFTHADVPALSSDVALSLFRVAEESLTNVAKHSHAKSARVLLNGTIDGIRLTVQDAGRGFDVGCLEQKAGLGFVSMRERLRAVRGTVGIDSSANGTRITVWVPAASLRPSTQTDALPASRIASPNANPV